MAKQLIISDATAFITLINIESFFLLEEFATKIIIPKEVYDEVSIFDGSKSFLDKKIKTETIIVQKVNNKDLYNKLKINLDSGESAAITLAIELKLPLIIDEKKGRSIAKNMDIEIIGLVGIIKALYETKKISKKRVLLLLEKLEQSNFRVSKKLLDMILKSS